jgi:hypothetical protein
MCRRRDIELGHDDIVSISFSRTTLLIHRASIVDNQASILTAVAGTNIWSGQNVQQFNTLAIAWSIASETFSIGSKYQWVRSPNTHVEFSTVVIPRQPRQPMPHVWIIALE